MSNPPWWEIQVTCPADLEDTVFWRLQELGCQGTASIAQGPEWVVVWGYLPQAERPAGLAQWEEELRQDAQASGLAQPQVVAVTLDPEDWAEHWKRHWQAQTIGERLVILPAWLPPPPGADQIILRLDPGYAFGTGTHPTTQLCLEALEMRLDPHWRKGPLTVADIGCGSGILSLAALLLGVEQVYAVDNDPLAVTATRQNRALNHLDPRHLVVEQGSVERLLTLLSGPLDGFVCNILLDVILDVVPRLRPAVHPKTWGILSGVLTEQVPPLVAGLEKHGWMVAALWQRQGWSCLSIRPNPD